ncbi:MAG TPA: PadR family transcriptional regulator [Mycobacteriales bacterium]|nr:PadR family transcriptional regulator [Mycobacteriales bacterium]
MSTTRLMVLGAVRIFQPAHGYFLRRELLSWNVEQWANINPGSIYNALRSLTRDGYLLESATERTGGKTRSTYELTSDGQSEFVQLLRDALWRVDQWDNSTLLGGLCFMFFLRREEMLDAMTARADALRGILSSMNHSVRDLQEQRAAPAQTVEQFFLSTERWEAELRWCEAFAKRLREGHYRFTPEEGWDTGPFRDGTWPGPLD